jgi:ubiquinone/menaquinone biosynthesis C-methylase UbiE
MHEKRFNGNVEKLRAPERLERLEVNAVVEGALDNLGMKLSILDIGTGSGVFAERFSASGHQVSGLDANPEMVTAAQVYVPSGTFKQGVAEALPFADHSFDLVFMGLLLHETDDPQKAVNEALRVTRNRLAVLEWPHEEQPFGPPMHERIAEPVMRELGRKAGFTTFQVIRLKNVVLYLMDR